MDKPLVRTADSLNVLKITHRKISVNNGLFLFNRDSFLRPLDRITFELELPLLGIIKMEDMIDDRRNKRITLMACFAFKIDRPVLLPAAARLNYSHFPRPPAIYFGIYLLEIHIRGLIGFRLRHVVGFRNQTRWSLFRFDNSRNHLECIKYGAVARSRVLAEHVGLAS